MTEPLAEVWPGMPGRKEVIVTRELKVAAQVDGMPFVHATPMIILAMEVASGKPSVAICRRAGRRRFL
jgi:hypothetical protein